MFWIALYPRFPSAPASALPEALPALQLLAWQALQFSPRVAQLEEALLLEGEGSLRLWGGRRSLLQKIEQLDSLEQPLLLASAPTGLAALALARHAAGASEAGHGLQAAPGLRQHLGSRQLQAGLDALPLSSLSAVARHGATLERLGCRCLGDLRALPRGGLNRRFDSALLDALDLAYGLRPESYPWILAPESFKQRVELPLHSASADSLLFAARRMLQALQVWLAARQSGIRSFELIWLYQHHQRDEEPCGSLIIRSAQTSRDLAHWLRLLAEHLAQQPLRAPVCELRLQVLQAEPLAPQNNSLLPDPVQQESVLLQFLERVSARLGAAKVLSPQLRSDHRAQCQTVWRAALSTLTPTLPQGGREKNAPKLLPPRGEGGDEGNSRTATPALTPTLPQGGRGQEAGRPLPSSQLPSSLTPTLSQGGRAQDTALPCWLLQQALPLPLNAQSQPLYQGPLKLLAGPQRIESGWWEAGLAGASAGLTLRDYFLAESEQAGLLWIYRERKPARGAASWFLHGIYG